MQFEGKKYDIYMTGQMVEFGILKLGFGILSKAK